MRKYRYAKDNSSDFANVWTIVRVPVGDWAAAWEMLSITSLREQARHGCLGGWIEITATHARELMQCERDRREYDPQFAGYAGMAEWADVKRECEANRAWDEMVEEEYANAP